MRCCIYKKDTNTNACQSEWYASKQSEKMAAIENELVNCLLRVSERKAKYTRQSQTHIDKRNGKWRAPKICVMPPPYSLAVRVISRGGQSRHKARPHQAIQSRRRHAMSKSKSNINHNSTTEQRLVTKSRRRRSPATCTTQTIKWLHSAQSRLCATTRHHQPQTRTTKRKKGGRTTKEAPLHNANRRREK